MVNNKYFSQQKNVNKKNTLIGSLSEVEHFLNNLNCIFSSVKFVNLLKKFK